MARWPAAFSAVGPLEQRLDQRFAEGLRKGEPVESEPDRRPAAERVIAQVGEAGE
jgi:hypothetical protein